MMRAVAGWCVRGWMIGAGRCRVCLESCLNVFVVIDEVVLVHKRIELSTLNISQFKVATSQCTKIVE